MVCRLYSAWALWFLGFPDRALERIEAGLALGQRLAHAHSLAFALNFAALLHNFRREFAAARRRAEAAIDLAQRASPAAVARAGDHMPGLCPGRPRSAGGGDRTASHRPGRLERDRCPPARYPVAWLSCGSPSSGGSVRRRAHRAGSGDRNRRGDRRVPLSSGAAPAERGRPGGDRRRLPKRHRGSSGRSIPPGASRRNRSSCAPRPASPGCGATRASAPRPTTCSRRSTAGSPRASTPPI